MLKPIGLRLATQIEQAQILWSLCICTGHDIDKAGNDALIIMALTIEFLKRAQRVIQVELKTQAENLLLKRLEIAQGTLQESFQKVAPGMYA